MLLLSALKLMQEVPCRRAPAMKRVHNSGIFSCCCLVCQAQVHQHQYTKAVLQQQINLCSHAKLSRTCCLCILWMPVKCLMQNLASNCIVLRAGDTGLC